MIDEDVASVGLQYSAQNIHQSGLSSTILSSKCNNLAGEDGKIDVIQSDDARKSLADLAHF